MSPHPPFSEVHAHEVAGRIWPARGQAGLGPVQSSEACTSSLERLRVDVDASVPTLVEQVVQYRRRGDVDRQDGVNLLGAQVSFLPSNGDELVNGLVLVATRPVCSCTHRLSVC